VFGAGEQRQLLLLLKLSAALHLLTPAAVRPQARTLRLLRPGPGATSGVYIKGFPRVAPRAASTAGLKLYSTLADVCDSAAAAVVVSLLQRAKPKGAPGAASTAGLKLYVRRVFISDDVDELLPR
jgi:hypothetical protein